jgi:membrane dipeptidase
MLIFDAHLDLAWNAIDWNRDLLLSVQEIRRRELANDALDFKARGRGTVSFPELRRGGVGIFIATLLARQFQPNRMPAIQRYTSMEAAYAAAMGQLAYYRALEEVGHLRWIKDVATLHHHVEEWVNAERGTRNAEPEDRAAEAGNDFRSAPHVPRCALPLGFILSMEGADPVLSPDQVQHWWDTGLRIIGPAHYGVSPYAHGTGTVGGLFPQGPALLKEMERVGMILDVTHLSDQCFDETLDIYRGPVLASHHNCRALVPDQRQLTDEQIKRLISRGAVIGAALDAWMLYPNWVRGKTMPNEAGVTLETVVDHIDRVCQLAGNARHAAIGSDLDGGFGTEQTPADLDTIADLQRLPELLRQRGYKEPDVEGILYGNWVHFFTQAWAGSWLLASVP